MPAGGRVRTRNAVKTLLNVYNVAFLGEIANGLKRRKYRTKKMSRS